MPLTTFSQRCRLLGTAALLLALSMSITSCAGFGDEGDPRIKNESQWSMPLDEFFVYSTALDNYAEQLLMSNCLEAQGHEWPVPWQNTDFPEAEGFNSVRFRLFSVELARKWGYEFAPPADPESARLWGEFAEITDSYFPNEELDAALDACTDEVRAADTEGSSNFDGQNYITGLAMQAENIVLQDESVIAATKRWRECLQPQVDFALPENPREGMPPREAEKQWGSVDGVASAAEIADAVADAECRVSSGLTTAAYERNWEEQEKLVAENRDALERIRDAAIERRKYLLEIVAENAPDGPANGG